MIRLVCSYCGKLFKTLEPGNSVLLNTYVHLTPDKGQGTKRWCHNIEFDVEIVDPKKPETDEKKGGEMSTEDHSLRAQLTAALHDASELRLKMSQDKEASERAWKSADSRADDRRIERDEVLEKLAAVTKERGELSQDLEKVQTENDRLEKERNDFIAKYEKIKKGVRGETCTSGCCWHADGKFHHHILCQQKAAQPWVAQASKERDQGQAATQKELSELEAKVDEAIRTENVCVLHDGGTVAGCAGCFGSATERALESESIVEVVVEALRKQLTVDAESIEPGNYKRTVGPGHFDMLKIAQETLANLPESVRKHMDVQVAKSEVVKAARSNHKNHATSMEAALCDLCVAFSKLDNLTDKSAASKVSETRKEVDRLKDEIVWRAEHLRGAFEGLMRYDFDHKEGCIASPNRNLDECNCWMRDAGDMLQKLDALKGLNEEKK